MTAPWESFDPVVSADAGESPAATAPRTLWGTPRPPSPAAVAIRAGGALLGLAELERHPGRTRCLAAWAPPGAEATLLRALVAQEGGRRRMEVVVDGGPPPPALDGHPPPAPEAALDGHPPPPALGAVLDRHAPPPIPETALDEHTPPPISETALEAALRAAGLRLLLDQVHLAGSLTPDQLDDAPVPSPWRHRAATAADRRTLLWLLARIWAGGSPLDLSPEAELDAIERACGAGRAGVDRRLWRVALHDGRPAGLILARRTAEHPAVGSLPLLGIVPELRGHGLGAALHRDALDLLRRAGATTYRESTARANAPMLALLRAAGCTPCGTTRVYAHGAAPAPTRADPLRSARIAGGGE